MERYCERNEELAVAVDSSNTSNDGSSLLVKKKKPEEIPWMSLPNKDQLFILALCRLSEPISNTCLLPYIYYLMRSVVASGNEISTSTEASRISQLSGILVAAFPLAQFATSMMWARLADSHGRRYVILGALFVSTISNLAFGFSRSFGTLILWRTLAGIANGNVGVMRAMTAEIVKEKRYETKAFLLLPLVFNSGMVAGLALGGCLADPVFNLPWLFGAKGILNFWGNSQGVEWALKYPYALPAIFNTALLGFSLLLALFGLKETLPDREDETDRGLKYGRSGIRWVKQIILRKRVKDYAALASDEMDDLPTIKDEEVKPLSLPHQIIQPQEPVETIWTRDVLSALVSFSLLPLHNNTFMHIFPVYLSNPPIDNSKATLFSFSGGLGLHSPSIGLWLGFFGVCGILLQMFIYPRLQSRIGTLGNFRIALFMFPITYAVAPYLSLLPQDGVFRWLCIGIVAWSQIMARTLAIPSTVILLTNSAPSRKVLGTIHGAGNMLSSLARAIGPAIGGWVFAWGMENRIVGAVWWFYLSVVAISALIWSYSMRDDEYR